MRPISVSLEGFSAYRERVTVEFGDADFFSLSGSTGSGKSSLIDAMIFAFYGRVPRLGGREVAPVISAGADRARVSVEFSVAGVTYTAVRLVQRTKTGATTPEARLQSGDEVLASGADEVTRAVEELLGLRFDDFTRTVVLPQGEFARFLTATKSERQALLRALLDLDYTAVRELAKGREAAASAAALQARNLLDSLEVPDADTIAETRQQKAELDELAGAMVEREGQLTRLLAASSQAQAAVVILQAARQRLDEISPPADLEELGEIADRAQTECDRIDEARQAAAQDQATAEAALAGLPSAEALESQARGHRRLSEIEERLRGLAADDVDGRLSEINARFEGARYAHQDAVVALNGARASHASHGLAATLVSGAPCPVCRQIVDTVPAPDVGAAELLAAAEEEERRMAAVVANLRLELDSAREESAKHQATRHELQDQRQMLAGEMEGGLSADEIEEARRARVETLESMAAAKERLDDLTTELNEAQIRLENATETLRTMGRSLMAARERVVDLGPPLPDSDSVLIQWKELMSWREEARAATDRQLAAAIESASGLEAAALEAQEALAADLERAGIEAVAPYAVAVTRAQERVLQRLVELERAVEQAAKLGAVAATAEEEAAVARSLAGHLRADGFERWLMAGALADLVAGANSLLSQLSSGGYSLHSDDEGGFAIVDHRNAGEIRPVATLSGGESFLVSLALALSLAETLSSGGGSELDAIFLDEGFGALDEESLDVVAGVLEELTGRGLMVGIVTHVRELAARAPVRFLVGREPGGSRIRVES